MPGRIVEEVFCSLEALLCLSIIFTVMEKQFITLAALLVFSKRLRHPHQPNRYILRIHYSQQCHNSPHHIWSRPVFENDCVLPYVLLSLAHQHAQGSAFNMHIARKKKDIVIPCVFPHFVIQCGSFMPYLYKLFQFLPARELFLLDERSFRSSSKARNGL